MEIIQTQLNQTSNLTIFDWSTLWKWIDFRFQRRHSFSKCSRSEASDERFISTLWNVENLFVRIANRCNDEVTSRNENFWLGGFGFVMKFWFVEDKFLCETILLDWFEVYQILCCMNSVVFEIWFFRGWFNVLYNIFRSEVILIWNLKD